jgi:hypothetical protein
LHCLRLLFLQSEDELLQLLLKLQQLKLTVDTIKVRSDETFFFFGFEVLDDFPP